MLLIGHRGCYYPGYNQNTLRAFAKVVDEGITSIEFDVQLCGDKELVVVHNLDLEEVSTGKGLVSTTDSGTLKQLYAGDPSRGEDEIPLLVEVLTFFARLSKDRRPVIHLELKGKATGIPTGRLLQTFFESGQLENDDVLISSFNWQELRNIREICPGIRIALLAGAIHRNILLAKLPLEGERYFSRVFAYGDEDFMLPRYPTLEENLTFLVQQCEDETVRAILAQEIEDCLTGEYYNDYLLDTACNMDASSINVWFKSLKADFVEEVHKRDLPVYVYTVNKSEELLEMAEIGVDGIFTDFFKESAQILAKYLT